MPKKERKWAAFKGVLPEFEPDDKDWFQQVLKQKEEYSTWSDLDVAFDLRDLKTEKDRLEKELIQVNLLIEAAQMHLAERFEHSKQQSLKLQSGEIFYLQDEPCSKVTDKQQCNAWFQENEMDEMRTVQWQSLNALVKERLEKGLPLPNGVDVFMKTTVKMRRS